MTPRIKKEELYTVKELAYELRHRATYVYAMRKAGFRMPGRTATLRQAKEWLTDHPDSRVSKAWEPQKQQITVEA